MLMGFGVVDFFGVVECSIFYAFYPDLLALFMFPSILSLEVDFLLRRFRSFPLLANFRELLPH